MKGSPKQMDSQSQPVLPMGSKIVQRWTAVPRAGHIGSEITHSVYGSLGVYRLTDLAIQQADTPTHRHRDTHTDRQTDSWQCKVCHKVTDHQFLRLRGVSGVQHACDSNYVLQHFKVIEFHSNEKQKTLWMPRKCVFVALCLQPPAKLGYMHFILGGRGVC